VIDESVHSSSFSVFDTLGERDGVAIGVGPKAFCGFSAAESVRLRM